MRLSGGPKQPGSKFYPPKPDWWAFDEACRDVCAGVRSCAGWACPSAIHFPFRRLLSLFPSQLSFLKLFAAAPLAPWKKVVEGSVWFLPMLPSAILVWAYGSACTSLQNSHS